MKNGKKQTEKDGSSGHHVPTIAANLCPYIFYAIHKNDVNNVMIKRKALSRSSNSNDGSALNDKCSSHLSFSER